MRVSNVLSFDLEHWYSATLLRDGVSDPVVHIEESVGIVLDLLADRDVTATFFVVGEVARSYPELVARIAAEDHEIGSHGDTHRPLFELSREQFVVELERSTRSIRDATGTTPVGFRAPNFSVTPRTQWAIEVLEAAGYRYDSSVFPVQTPMYGVSGAPIRPYALDPNAPFKDQAKANGTLTELPVAVIHPWLKLPVAGGFYARLLPTWLLKRGIRTLNRRGVPATIYFHPWEFNPAVKTGTVPAHKRFVSFYGIHRLQAKLTALLDAFTFTTASAVAHEHSERGEQR